MSSLEFSQTLKGLFTLARFVVRGNSMLPTLVDRQSVLAVRDKRVQERLRRGDIVVFRNPVLNDRTFVKRIVGLPNEVLRLEEGLIYVNEELLGETYLERPFTENQGAIREWWMGPDQYFVLGDNRRYSQDDSRAFGFVNRRSILGRVWLRCWPPQSWGKVSRPSYSSG